ncbi:SWIB/MDM2 domain-containing protein [Paenalcaligenes sp.]|uniref:SWIB/MDM2 domain-containing protein n=1 Tax=Paenalcaligenes sp. TaxID=1966342 RepID=UPI00260D0155|nr:SWIB/MDM2 domain-containing protein [Paenalcaligenes sp.]
MAKATKTTAAKSTKTAKTTKKTANSGFMKPMTPSAELAEIVGKKPLPRTEVTKKMWEYIKKHDLQAPENRRNINADAKLKPIFGKDQISMFELSKCLNAHLS